MLDIRALSKEIKTLQKYLHVLSHMIKMKEDEFVADEFMQKRAVQYIQKIIESGKISAIYILRDRKDILRDGFVFRDIAKYGLFEEEFAVKADQLLSRWGKEEKLEADSLYKFIPKFLTTFERYVEYITNHIDIVT